MTHCSARRIHLKRGRLATWCVLSEMFRYAVSREWCSVGCNKGTDVHQEKTLPAACSLHRKWTHGFVQFILNCHPAVTVLQHKPWSLWTRRRFPLCNGDDIPTVASSHSLWATEWNLAWCFCCCGPSILRFVCFRKPSCTSRWYWAVTWIFAGHRSAWTNLVVLLCDLSGQQGFSVHKPVTDWKLFFSVCLFVCLFIFISLMAPFWLNWSHCSEWTSQNSGCVYIGISTSGIKHHNAFRVA